MQLIFFGCGTAACIVNTSCSRYDGRDRFLALPFTCCHLVLGGPTRKVVGQVASSVCFNNCSGHGHCVDYSCECDVGYEGDDCSFCELQGPQNLQGRQSLQGPQSLQDPQSCRCRREGRKYVHRKKRVDVSSMCASLLTQAISRATWSNHISALVMSILRPRIFATRSSKRGLFSRLLPRDLAIGASGWNKSTRPPPPPCKEPE